MIKILFTINLHGKEFSGYLHSNEIGSMPKTFFVFLGNIIIGELLFRNKWIFDQGGRHKFLKQMNTGEREFVAEYLGNIVELWYE